MEEIFKTIEGFKNYSVSNLGNVANQKTGKILSPGINTQGYKYVVLSLNGKRYTKKVHRLVAKAFIENPCNKPIIDHIDNNRTNNNVSNLRFVTKSENGMNRLMSSNNTSGIKGVCFHKPSNKWTAQIQLNGKKIHIGYYDTNEDASEARKLKAIELFGEFMNDCEI
jgi:hypothetical protein